MITQDEYRVFCEQLASAELMADRLSRANHPDSASQIMAMRQSFRHCLNRAIEYSTALYETDQVLSAVIQGEKQ